VLGVVKVFVDISRFAATSTRTQLRERVNELEDAGVTGISVSDHLFTTAGQRSRRESAGPSCDPLTTLSVIAGLTDRLELQTMVVNTAWVHPALLLRQFLQLATLVGGAAVTAGLGAGWSAEEFDALGWKMPRFEARMDRFAEVLEFARNWLHSEMVSVAGEAVVARDLPRSPPAQTPPRLLVGGGSDRILDLAGRFADVIDLHGDPRHGRVAGATMTTAAHGDAVRRVRTTVADLEVRLPLVDAAAIKAGRSAADVSVSTQIWGVLRGGSNEVAEQTRSFAALWDLDPMIELGRSPYFLVGEPAQMAEALAERTAAYRLSQISLPESGEPGKPDARWFCKNVLPLL
jgi:alkanesulfonate monooxygenase SsuD/methylene tetrahydromethanopterin reductase-like flavin-dependent oxidoreductase (luciferase family)